MQIGFWFFALALAFASGWWLIMPLIGGAQPALRHKQLAKQLAFILSIVPLAGLVIYLFLGAPHQPDAPLAPRLAGKLENLPSGAIMVRLEERLRHQPDDTQGWRLLARLRAASSMPALAGDAWRRVIDLKGDDAEAFAGLAQALIAQEGGVIPEAAIFWLDKTLQLEPDNLTAQFWRGMAWQQQGQTAKAQQIWKALRGGLSDNLPLAKVLDENLQTGGNIYRGKI